METRPTRRGSYSEEEIERGLQAVAYFSGDTRRAAKELKSLGHPVPRTTLRNWIAGKYVERYERARVAIRDRVWEEIAEDWQRVARKSARAAEQLVESAETEAKAGELRRANEAAAAARNLATVGGIGNDKAAAVHGRPTEIHERRDASELVRALANRFGGVVSVEPAVEVETRGEELPTRELEDERSPVSQSK